MELGSSLKQRRNRKQKNGKKTTMRLYDWNTELRNHFQIKIESPDWLDLPPHLMSVILMKLDPVDIVINAQNVCTSWRNICKDLLIWNRLDTPKITKQFVKYLGRHKLGRFFKYRGIGREVTKITRFVIDGSRGQLIDVRIHGNYDLLQYIAERSPLLTRLRLSSCADISDDISDNKELREAVSNFPLLAELDVTSCSLSETAIEAIGRCCPQLKSFKFSSRRIFRVFDWDSGTDSWDYYHGIYQFYDKHALAIAKHMQGLHHLALLRCRLSNSGLQAILDGCSHLVSLDLRGCPKINLRGVLGRMCRKQIKDFRGPSDDGYNSEYSVESEEDNSSSRRKDNGDHKSDVLDDDDFSQFSSHHNGYLYDEYDEIHNSRKFIESSLLLL